jgi:hypothetical protein
LIQVPCLERTKNGGIGSQEDQMPKSHFEIVDGYKIEDPVGMDLKSEDQAKQLATDIARQIAIDVKDSDARKVVVKDEAGSHVHQVPVKKCYFLKMQERDNKSAACAHAGTALEADARL